MHILQGNNENHQLQAFIQRLKLVVIFYVKTSVSECLFIQQYVL